MDDGFSHKFANRILVWTDGGCERPEIPLLAHSGSGIFFYADCPLNCGFPTGGASHSAQRAEPEAILYALCVTDAPLHVRTDSEQSCNSLKLVLSDVLDVVQAIRSHTDIWIAIQTRVRAMPAGHYAATWVKGHAKRRHIHSGQTTELDKLGNEQAGGCPCCGWCTACGPTDRSHGSIP